MLPILCIVILLGHTIVPIPTDLMLCFLIGAVMICVGMGLFTFGAETSMTPIGNRIGTSLTKSRNLIIAAVIMVCGLGFSNGITFQVGGAVIKLTALAIAAIAGVLLNAILPGNDYVFGTDAKGDGYANLGTY